MVISQQAHHCKKKKKKKVHSRGVPSAVQNPIFNADMDVRGPATS